jgi:hypothetical protein
VGRYIDLLASHEAPYPAAFAVQFFRQAQQPIDLVLVSQQ